nr:immunoglobulin heavy chain junction region [Macaca mulatta]MOW19213.1 immunoglobulin heavy chain junction region [Macaca mulatta]MOW19654.1 immunoglobulin heavy chain junction region [Macaca mulatta]MOW19715.1 immunoglobulin heavy chain junction region [Macaca mulatta]MOW20139.1 immunoglobulin heavy chain junction region [Macaca mulatta]
CGRVGYNSGHIDYW